MKSKTKDPTHFPAMMLRLLIFSLIVAFGISVQAQKHFHGGSSFPAKPQSGDWYFNPKRHELWRWDDKWILVKENAYEVQACHRVIICNWDQRHILIAKQGKEELELTNFFCGDSVFLAYTDSLVDQIWHLDGYLKSYSHGMTFYDQHADPILHYGGIKSDIQQYEIQKMIAWCLPAPEVDAGNSVLPYEELHYWGVFGENGNWLVEPKFDAPFFFENGIAEVLYYGQRRRINEKGEFVE